MWFAGADQGEASLRFAPGPVYLCLSACTKHSLQVTRENGSSTNTEEHNNLIQLLTLSYPSL